MPAVLSHYFQSLDVIELLKKENIKVNKDAFVFGGQGPDFLYFHRLSPIQLGRSQRKIGVKLHETDIDKTLSVMSEYLLQYPDDNIVLSYVLGFISHYALDRDAHPYVYAVQEAIIEAEHIKYRGFFVHCRIEHSLDVIMLRDRLQLNGSQFNATKILTNDMEIITAQAKLMLYVINRLYGENTISERQLINAFRDMRSNLKLLHDPFLIKRTIFAGLEKLLHTGPAVTCAIRPLMEDGLWDYANVEKAVWYNPYNKDKERDDSFFEIVEKSASDSDIMIRKLLENIKNHNCNVNFTGKLDFKGAPAWQKEGN